jgi:hypothetical protein
VRITAAGLPDQRLGTILRGDPPPNPDAAIFTTGYWYVRLCQVVLAAAVHLEAHVLLSVNSPKLEAALEAEGLTVTVG